MSDLDDFLTVTLARHAKAADRSHNGDPTLYLQEWSTREPVTVFGARESVVGWEAASQAIGAVVARFSNGSPLDFELLAAGVGGELAYLVGYEHATMSVDNGPVQPSTLRVTHVYRREDGDWKLVHRHADRATIDQPAPTEAPGTERACRQVGRSAQRPPNQAAGRSRPLACPRLMTRQARSLRSGYLASTIAT